MKRISELVVRIADLVEAEGRSLRGIVQSEARTFRMQVSRFVLSLAWVAGAIVLVLAGIVLIGVAEFLLIEQSWGRPAAAAVTGLGLLLLGILSIWVFNRTTRE